MIRSLIQTAVGVLMFAPWASACLWDSDTLAMERRQLPNVLELIAGKFLRHSPEYYQWRIADRQKRIAANANDLEAYDDLAVAYDKLGQHDQAVAVMLTKETLKPGLYETYANLGTFHIHAGRLEEGLTHIDRALAINPDAHFGREVYQRYLVEYVLKRRSQEVRPRLPLLESDSVQRLRDGLSLGIPWGFAAFVCEKTDIYPEDPNALQTPEGKNRHEQIAKALRGVQGMMYFGNYDHPILLEAFASLLSSSGVGGDYRDNALLLAARALLSAADHVDNDEARRDYEIMAASLLGVNEDWKDLSEVDRVARLRAEFAAEVAEADAWMAEVRRNELAWIAAGGDVDAEFAKVYYQAPSLRPSPGLTQRADQMAARFARQVMVAVLVIALAALLGVAILKLIDYSRARDAAASPPEAGPLAG